MSKKKDIILAVSMIAYNHENYIAQAIEGVLLQKTDFKYCLIISDDNSKDLTPDICKDFESTYPGIIRFIDHPNNIGMMRNLNSNLNSCVESGANYIAICEGDDYWTDPLKLQKQVDFLSDNREYSITAHDVELKYEGVEENFPFQINWNKNKFTFQDEFEHHFIPTLSVVFRASLVKSIPGGFTSCFVGDIPLFLFLLSVGNGWYFKEKMAVKRKNPGGVTQDSKRKLMQLKGSYITWRYIKSFTPKEMQSQINLRLSGYERALARNEFRSHKIVALNYVIKSLLHHPFWFLNKLTSKFLL